MIGMPKLESQGNRPLQMTFEDHLKALVYFHLDEHHSAQHLLQVFEQDDFARNQIAPEDGIKKSSFSEATNSCGLEQFFYVFENLQAQATQLLPKKHSELGNLIGIDGSLIVSVTHSFILFVTLYFRIQALTDWLKEQTKMITALVQIKLPEPMIRDKAKAVFAKTAPKYRDVKGLIRKYYLLSEDGATAGGVYLWKTREAAEQLYTDDWKTFIKQKYGTKPSVTYFISPVVVDNLLGQIIADDQ